MKTVCICEKVQRRDAVLESIEWMLADITTVKDHILCSHDMNVKLKSLGIPDKLLSSDHLPMFANLFFFVNSTPELNICSTSSDKVTFNWCKASDYDILHYRNLTFSNSMIPVLPAMICNDI